VRGARWHPTADPQDHVAALRRAASPWAPGPPAAFGGPEVAPRFASSVVSSMSDQGRSPGWTTPSGRSDRPWPPWCHHHRALQRPPRRSMAESPSAVSVSVGQVVHLLRHDGHGLRLLAARDGDPDGVALLHLARARSAAPRRAEADESRWPLNVTRCHPTGARLGRGPSASGSSTAPIESVRIPIGLHDDAEARRPMAMLKAIALPRPRS